MKFCLKISIVNIYLLKSSYSSSKLLKETITDEKFGFI